ncbi:helix-turn-helix domain-containing protein [Paracoccus caeni]|uniref:helix-turn-helix domain-containing protein n=1 Tax=Paracoccus caeni TaxID=657651 RepID=UPI0038993A0C
MKRALRAKGVKFVDIASDIGCPPSLVTMVSQGRRSSKRVEMAIASTLNRPPQEIWPDRYDIKKQGDMK